VTIEDLGNLGDFVGGIAVIATLMYLAVQIRQNSRSLQAAALDSAHDHFVKSQLAVAQDPELAEILERGASDYLGLEKSEKRRYRAFLVQQLRGIEISFFKHQQKILPQSTWEGYEQSLMYSFGRPGWQQCWGELKPIFSPEFCQFVDGIIVSREAYKSQA
jgi:hypothetical protein